MRIGSFLTRSLAPLLVGLALLHLVFQVNGSPGGMAQTVRMAQDPGLVVGRQVKIVDGAVVAND